MDRASGAEAEGGWGGLKRPQRHGAGAEREMGGRERASACGLCFGVLSRKKEREEQDQEAAASPLCVYSLSQVATGLWATRCKRSTCAIAEGHRAAARGTLAWWTTSPSTAGCPQARGRCFPFCFFAVFYALRAFGNPWLEGLLWPQALRTWLWPQDFPLSLSPDCLKEVATGRVRAQVWPQSPGSPGVRCADESACLATFVVAVSAARWLDVGGGARRHVSAVVEKGALVLPGLGDFSKESALSAGLVAVREADQYLVALAAENGDDLVASVSELALPGEVAVLVADGDHVRLL
ncbi:hypothetical protein ES708_17731 [subsurface metagenome]